MVALTMPAVSAVSAPDPVRPSILSSDGAPTYKLYICMYIYIYIYIYTYIDIDISYIYIDVCVCVYIYI